jgi:hypothetical protein
MKHSKRWARLAAVSLAGVALCASIGVSSSFSAPRASAVRAPGTLKVKKGDLVLTFSGSGTQTYNYSVPEFLGSLGGCEFPSDVGSVSDSFNWSFEWVFSHNGGSLGHPVTNVGGSTVSNETQGPCDSTGSPGGTLQCTAPYEAPNGGGGGSDDVEFDTSKHEIKFESDGVGVGAYAPASCAGVNLTNPYDLSQSLTGTLKYSESALKKRGQVSGPATGATSLSCDSTICGYQTCTDEPGSAQPGAGPVSCDVDNKYSATIKLKIEK